MSKIIFNEANKEKESLEYLEWLNNLLGMLTDLDETDGYLVELERCKEEDSKDYYIGLYEGVMATIKALDKSFHGDAEELVDLIYGTEAENVRHWEEYESMTEEELESTLEEIDNQI